MNTQKNNRNTLFYQQNSVPIILISAALFIFGMISLFFLDFGLIPDIEYPELVVVTSYPNGSSDEVKNIVTLPVERAVGSLKGVKNIHTLSRDGLSITRIRYQWGENLATAHIELREKLDLAGAVFPREVKRPVIINYQTAMDAVMGISVVSEAMDPRALYLLCVKDVVPVLEKTDSVAGVDVEGGEKPQVQVVVDPEQLAKYNIGVDEIRDALIRSNKSVGVGMLRENEYEWLIRVDGAVVDYHELENIIIKRNEKKLVSLGDVARVEYASEKRESGIRIDGQDALMLSVYKRPGIGILKVAERVDNRVRMLNARYGGDIRFEKVFDESGYVRKSLRQLIEAIVLGIVCTIFSVYLFIRSVRLSIIVILTIPLSMSATCIVMKLTGVSINLLSLGGFSLAVGMIVDNAVIMVTSFKHEKNMPVRYDGRTEKNAVDLVGHAYPSVPEHDANPENSERYGAPKKVVVALFSATLTTVVVFLPVFFLSGILKHVFFQLSLVILVSLLFSLFFSVLLIPALVYSSRTSPLIRSPRIRSNETLSCVYARLLKKTFKYRFFFLAALCVIILPGIVSYGAIDKRLLESFPGSWFYVKLFVKNRVPYEYTDRLTGYVTDAIYATGNIKKVIARVGIDSRNPVNNLDGLYGTNTAVIRVYTHSSGDAVYASMHALRQSLHSFTGVDFIVSVPDSPLQRLVLRSDFDARIKIFDPSPPVLAEEVGTVRDFMEQNRIATDILTSYYATHIQNSIVLKRNEMALYRVDEMALAALLSTAVSGRRVGTWKRDEHEIPIVLRFDDASISGIDDILKLSIKNSEQKEISVGALVTVKKTDAPRCILRENQSTFAKIDFDLTSSSNRIIFSHSTPARKKIESFLESKKLAYEYEDGFSLLRENYLEILLSIFIAVFLEYIILASGFKSFSKPLLVIVMIPLSIPGILLILYIAHFSININTFMSILVLIGLLVNNGIMLFLEYSSSGAVDTGGVIDASVRRLKPILITTVSTILALVPTLFTQNRIQVSLAATLILGLVYSTGITLVYMPLLYSIFYLRRKTAT